MVQPPILNPALGYAEELGQLTLVHKLARGGGVPLGACARVSASIHAFNDCEALATYKGGRRRFTVRLLDLQKALPILAISSFLGAETPAG